MASNGDRYSEGQGPVDCSGVQITYLADMSEELDGHRTSSEQGEYPEVMTCSLDVRTCHDFRILNTDTETPRAETCSRQGSNKCDDS